MRSGRMVLVVTVAGLWLGCDSQSPVQVEDTASGPIVRKAQDLPDPPPTQVEDAGVVLYACYNPSGSVYRIKEEGLGDECSSPRHVQFSWNEHGPQR